MIDSEDIGKLLVVVVLYNLLFEQSQICRVAYEEIEQNILQLIIVDNSTIEEIGDHNRTMCTERKIPYIGDLENLGLSRAYNLALDYCFNNEIDFNWLMIFDQDTIVPMKIFPYVYLQLRNLPNKNGPLLLFPIVNTSNSKREVRLSPRKVFLFSKQKALYINSGMIFSRVIANEVSYDETIFLDFVDYDFILKIREHFKSTLQEIPSGVNLIQNFSGITKNSKEKDLWRFELFVNDLMKFRENWPQFKFEIYFKLFKRALKLCMQHRDIDFLKKLFTVTRDE